MSLLDLFTGGKSGQAENAQNRAIDALQNVQAPTAAELTLPQLQQYAIAQNMTPAQMQAFLQQYNALAQENVDQTGTNAQKDALAQLAQVANAGAEGTPTERAQVSQIEQDMGRNLAGQRGAIEQAAQARGVPLGLLQAALSNQNAGQDQQAANQAALQAQSQAYQTALNAMAQGGQLGQGLQGQQNTQANTVAQAQNAMQQFNAANQQNAAAANAGYQQQANQYNTQNAQNVANQNTGNANARTQYNAQVPQTVFQDQFQKASGVAGAQQNMANLFTGQGQQNAGIIGGLIGSGSQALGAGGYSQFLPGGSHTSAEAGAPASVSSIPGQEVMALAHGGVVGDMTGYAKGGITNPIPADYKAGGMVPGQAKVAGDSKHNDTVPVTVSPGEAVIPRTAVQANPQAVLGLLAQADQGPHPQDVAALLQAMKHLRGAR